MPQERHPVLWIGQVAVITLPAEIDVTNADPIQEDLLAALSQGAVLLIADLSGTAFCDSAGVGALVRTFRQAKANSADVRLVVATPGVQRVLAITGVDRLIGIYPSVSASMAGPYDLSGHNGPQERATPEDNAAKVDTDGGA